MPDIKIVCDAAKMSDPDLDIRYALPDYLASKIPGLVDDGYDYGEKEKPREWRGLGCISFLPPNGVI